MPKRINLVDGLRSVLSGVGISWSDLCKGSSEVVLFGSRAVGVEDESSDWDVLCVGSGKRVQEETIDLLWITPWQSVQPKWLGSELANHIALFGVWLLGESAWKSSVYVSDESIDHKLKKLRSRIEGLSESWPHLSYQYRIEKAISLRRDFQRLLLLRDGCGVPPNAILDRQWGSFKVHERRKIEAELKRLWTMNRHFSDFDRFWKEHV